MILKNELFYKPTNEVYYELTKFVSLLTIERIKRNYIYTDSFIVSDRIWSTILFESRGQIDYYR
jgi:hypothetical protein